MRHPLFILALLAALPAFGAGPSRSAAPDLATAEVVDLTHPFDAKTLYWPTSPSTFQLTNLHEGKAPGAISTPPIPSARRSTAAPISTRRSTSARGTARPTRCRCASSSLRRR